MMDRRLTPANARVADVSLRDKVDAAKFVQGRPARIVASVADVLASPGGRRDRQLLFGAEVSVYEVYQGHAFVRALAGGYVGYVAQSAVGFDTKEAATHNVVTRATHAYPEPDFKSGERMLLSLNSRITLHRIEGRFAETDVGFVPSGHLRELDRPLADPVAVAERFHGTPYLWGGNSTLGIDCSGLIQVALNSCGVACPGDSDMQQEQLGSALPENTTPRRGDIFFWKGHVAWVVDSETLLHANAFHMSTQFEPLKEACTRILEQGDGPVTAHVRLPLSIAGID